MPVPWTSKCTLIPKVEDRAITLQQLRDLYVFVQRLCQARLLRHSDGAPLSVFDVNMYHLQELVIKPVISWQEEQRGTRLKCSWVEFVADAPAQSPHMMFSHSWAGRFVDFMAVVKALARDRGFGGNVAIWICTFANSQFGEDFGTGLRDSPFWKAVRAADAGVVLVVDREASSLHRIWCGLELHLTMKLSKPLCCYTSAGQVGVTVTGGPLVEAVETWDVTRMEASQDSDRRQILNFLAGGELLERKGLKLDEDGNLATVDGWRKQLDGEETTADAPPRQGGRLEYAYEANLFKTHGEKFQKLNQAVQGKVLDAAAQQGHGAGAAGLGCKIPSFTCRGITLGELRTCIKRCKAVATRSGVPWEKLTHGEAGKAIISPMSPEGFSYAEALSPGPRTPQIIIDSAWKDTLDSCMNAVEWFVEAMQLADSTVFWWLAFCVDMSEFAGEVPDWHTGIMTMIKNCECWLSLLPRDKEGIVRSSRMQQFQLCFENARPIYLGCEDGVLACTTPFPGGAWEFGNFDAEIARVLLDAQWEDAKCGNKEVQAFIREQVRSARGGFAGFAARLARVAAGPILRQAASADGCASKGDIARLCLRPGFNINSLVLRGALGETALHIAAAAGNLQTMRLLLSIQADPNAEDHIRETPLHLAAMAGMAGAVRLLLQSGAMANVESAFAESPLFVAEQSPAGFLLGGGTTQKVVALLQAWDAACAEDPVPAGDEGKAP